MYDHPINLALRFLLEIAALIAIGIWGWAAHQGVWRWLLMLGVPLAAAALWGIFRVDNDPGPAPVAVPGLLRLLIEFVVFGGAVALLYLAGRPLPALILGVILLLHYLVSYDRVIWLLALK